MLTDAVLAAIADDYDTPAYAYDLDEVVARVRGLLAALPEHVELAYAVKANPLPAILEVMAGEGIGADVASGAELRAVERAGFEPNRVVFTGPGKRDEELAAAVALGLRAITVESLGELERLRAIAAAAGRRPRIMLRAAGDDRAGNVIGSGGGRFGMRDVDLLAALRIAAESREVELIGLHRFTASNVLDATELLGAAGETVALAASLETPLELIDLGGGLGIPYRDDEPALDVGAVASGLLRLLDALDPASRLLLEPGRYLVGPAGVYLVRVLDVKRSAKDAVIATVDGGIHHLLSPALPGRRHRIRSLALDAAERPLAEVVVGGPLCTTFDILGRVQLPRPCAGDLLAIGDVGAYGFTQSMPLFLSHPIPPQVVVSGGIARLASPRMDPETVLGRPGELVSSA